MCTVLITMVAKLDSIVDTIYGLTCSLTYTQIVISLHYVFRKKKKNSLKVSTRCSKMDRLFLKFDNLEMVTAIKKFLHDVYVRLQNFFYYFPYFSSKYQW